MTILGAVSTIPSAGPFGLMLLVLMLAGVGALVVHRMTA
jgi:hypothetical protein